MMTHDEMIAVIQHHKNGGKVQIQGNINGKWNDAESPKFNFLQCNYRAKPEPLVLWSAHYVSGGLCCSFTSESEARKFVTTSIISLTLKKFVEVTE